MVPLIWLAGAVGAFAIMSKGKTLTSSIGTANPSNPGTSVASAKAVDQVTPSTVGNAASPNAAVAPDQSAGRMATPVSNYFPSGFTGGNSAAPVSSLSIGSGKPSGSVLPGSTGIPSNGLIYESSVYTQQGTPSTPAGAYTPVEVSRPPSLPADPNTATPTSAIQLFVPQPPAPAPTASAVNVVPSGGTAIPSPLRLGVIPPANRMTPHPVQLQ